MMNSSNNLAAALAAALAVLLAVGAVAPVAMAAAPTYDEETSNSSSTSDWTDGTTVTDFDASSNNTSTVQISADSNETKLVVKNNETGAVVYTNSSMETVYNDSGNNTYHTRANISHDELAHLERGANDSVTLDLVAYNNTSAATQNTTTIQVTLNTTDDYAVERVQSLDSDDVVAFDEAGELPVINMSLGDSETKLSGLSMDVNGSSTDAVVVLDDNSSDHAATAVEGLSSGDRAWSVALTASSGNDSTTTVPVYYESAPSDVDNTSTYGVYHADYEGSGHPAVVLHTGDDFSDAESVEVSGTVNAGFIDQFSIYGLDALSGVGMMSGFGSAAFAGLAISLRD